MNEGPVLARRIGLPLITFYGLGTILGAGIYVLVGKVSGAAGLLSPLSFLLAALIAGITALSYARLVAWYPKSAGEAVYLQEAFGYLWLSALAGWMVVAVGVVSSATIVIGFAGYFGFMFSWASELVMVCLVLFIAAIAAWGIAESLRVAAVMTVVEIAGLLLVVFVTRDSWQGIGGRLPDYLLPSGYQQWAGVLSGTFLAFYAFIGFEDMVNVAEEVRKPEKTMPLAIVIALLVTTILYMLVAFVAVSVMPVEQLQASEAPLSELLANQNPLASKAIAVISLFAVLNGALIQTIMASRVLYGMANASLAPVVFARVNSRTRTPLVATFTLSLAILLFALFMPIVALAKLTSSVVLCIFILVNIALWKLDHSATGKTGEGDRARPGFPAFPLTGAAVALGLLCFQVYHELLV